MFDKNADKNQRQPVGGGKANENTKAVRPNLSRNMKLDSSFYEALHPDMKFLKINDVDGDVQWWIDQGAVPVERKSEQRKIYKGLNDKGDSEYVNWHGGESDGTAFKVWLLMMEPEEYDRVKLGPQRERQAAIAAAMSGGANQSDVNAQTYAPNLEEAGGRGQGHNQIRNS